MANQLLVKGGGDKKPKLTIEQSINKLFLNPELSDVCFLVGPERERVNAHRIFLAIESDAFKSMFYGELKETKHEIEVPDLSPVGFRNMIKYFYTKKVEEIDLSEIYPTYMAANKYLASGLIEDLTEHITKNCLKASNICVIYDQLLKLNIDDSLTGDVKRRVALMGSAACGSDSFKQIDKDTLVSILNFNWLDITESDLLKACLKWTDSEVARQGADQANKRAVFDSIKRLIRFGDLSLSEFGSIPQIEDYLTVEEIGSVFLHLYHKNKRIQIDYRSPRKPRPKADVARVRNGTKTWTSAHDQQFSISVDRRVCICSIKTVDVYGSTGLKVEVYRDNKWTPLDCQTVANPGSNSGYQVYTIELTYVLEPNIKNELRFSFLANPGYNLRIFGQRATSLSSDDGGVVFEIKSESGYHCIDSIEFYEPLD